MGVASYIGAFIDWCDRARELIPSTCFCLPCRVGYESPREGGMMIQLRTRDAALQPSPMVDQATVAVAYQYLAWRRSGFLSGPWQA